MSDYTISAAIEVADRGSSKVEAFAGSVKDADEAMKRAGASQSQYQQKMSGVSQSAGKMADALRPAAIATVGLGTAAGVAAGKFETTFARSVGLAGLAANEVENVKDKTLELAEATGRGPQDLAEGFYFISSAGIQGKAALDALEVSAKGAAAGLGDTATVADVLTSAINAYGEANITAAQAGDVLAETAKQGKAEASALAPQFGRLLPVAAQLGVSFDQVGGALAYLTRTSGNASLASTEVAGIMRKLLAPTEQAQKALGNYGITADQLRARVGKDGLLATLQYLFDTVKGNANAFNDIFDDAEAFTGALALTGKNAEGAKEVFDALKNSSGSLGNAFNQVAGTEAFKMQQSMAKVKVAAVEVGESLLPLAASAAGIIGTAATGFANLPAPIRGFAEVLGGTTVAAYGLAKGVETVSKATESLSKIAGTGATAVTAIGAAAAGLTILALAYAEVTAKSGDLKKATDDYTASIQDQTKAVSDLNDAYVAKTLADDGKIKNLAKLGLTTAEFAKAATGSAAGVGDFVHRMRELDSSMNGTNKNANGLVMSLIEIRASAALSAAAVANAALTNEKLGRSAIETAAAAKLPADQFAALQGILADGVVTSQELSNSNLNLSDVLSILRSISGDSASGMKGLGEAADSSAAGMAGAADSAHYLTGALSGLGAAYAALASSQLGLERSELSLGDANRSVAEAQEAVNTGGKSLIKTRSGGAAATDDAAKAERRLEDATRGVETAQRRVEDVKRSIGDAEAKQAKAEEDRAGKVADLAKAYEHLRDVQNGKAGSQGAADAAEGVDLAERGQVGALLDLERAKLRAKKADADYAAAVEKNGATSDEAVQADLDRRQAALDLLDAQDRAKDAEKDLIEARRKLAGETRGYAAGSDELKKAQDEVKKATDAVADAEKAVTDSTRTVEDKNRDLDDALRGVEDAERGVIDAQTTRSSGSGGYNATVKTQAELERDLKTALLDQKEAYAGVIEKAAIVRENAQKYADLLSGHVTPEAEMNALKTEAQALKLEELAGKLEPGSELRRYLEDWITQLGYVPGTVKTTIELEVLSRTAKQLAGIAGALDLVAPEDLAKITGQRANGGSVMAGGAYLVGENRPEIFVPSSSGYVYPSVSAGLGAIAGAQSAGGDSYSTTVYVNVAGNVTAERDLAAIVAKELGRMARR